MEVTVFLYVNSVKIYQFKAKYSEIKPYPICLGNILKGFTVNNMKINYIKWTHMWFFCWL